jgi:glycosyltransferase involved in cell wall biosynthesis
MADIINNHPLVTVGICCYNREEGFKHTLQCITNQTYQNLEIIISQDFNETLDFGPIVNRAKDPRITFCKQPRRLSMYNNFCFLLEKAKGQYFMWAADDDWWAPEFIEKIMLSLLANPAAVVGFCDFMEVDEDNKRIASYPNHLPLLQEFTTGNDVKRVKNYINQFEGFGKANLFYAIFKTEVLRSKQVIDILKKGDLPGDMLINLAVLLQGELVVVPQLLRTCTYTPVKDYIQEMHVPRLKNLLVIRVNFGGLHYLQKKWSNYLYSHFAIIRSSGLGFPKKIGIYLTIIKKIALFYYDLLCINVYLRGYNIFSKIKRQNTLS